MNPKTTKEMYLNRIATSEGAIPDAPTSTEEMFLAKIAGQDIAVPAPSSREEMYLNIIAESGGGGVSYPAWNGGNY